MQPLVPDQTEILDQVPRDFPSALTFPSRLHIHVLTPKHISAPCSYLEVRAHVEIRNFHTRFEFFVSLDKSEELETLNMNLF